MTDSIVRAIDVGYGNTKYVVFHQQGEAIQCSLIPSIAPQAGSGADLSGGVFQRRNTVTVDVNGVQYEVGRDAQLAQDASYGRVLDSKYALTDVYMALVRGAISYMGVDKIDVLVLGLPVNTFERHQADLVERMTGSHLVPAPTANDPRAQRRVAVHSVRVLPQPVGAFFDHAIRHNLYGRMKGQMNLIIDPGYYTLDWVVAQGVKVSNARSGAHSGGMSAVLATMAEAIGRELGTQLTDVAPIDAAIRSGEMPRFCGKPFDISAHLKIGKEKARQFVSVLATRVGNNGVDIDNIILAGGGASFFRDLIQEKFPNHELIVTEEPVFANVRGFQLAGEQYAASQAFRRSPATA